MKISNKRRILSLAIASAALVPFLSHASAAEDFPTRPIKIMIGFPPGGSSDAPMRVLAEQAAKIFKQPVIIENKTGAGGTLAALQLQNVPADGYTLAVAPISVFRMPYVTEYKMDPLKELRYVIGLTGYAFGIVVQESSPITSFEELVEYSKKTPVTYSTAGPLTTNHLTMEQISELSGGQFNHIPYKGAAESVNAVLGGHVDMSAEASSWIPHVKDGRLRLLVVWGDKRMPSFPDVPTLREVGIDLAQTSPWGIVAPKDTDPAIVEKLHDVFKIAMETPEFAKILSSYDMTPEYRSSEEYYEYAVQSTNDQKEVLDKLGLLKDKK